jgi:hypothetical protein
MRNQEDIQFDSVYSGALFNRVAGGGFDMLLPQSINSPGVRGDYSVPALVDNLSPAAFSADLTFLGLGHWYSAQFPQCVSTTHLALLHISQALYLNSDEGPP